MPLDSFSRALAAVRATDVPAARLGLRVADTFGALVTGARTREAFVLERLFGSRSVSPYLAGTIRLTEIDDIELTTCVTPSSIIVPAALAVASDVGATPELFARALFAGYVTLLRHGRCIGGIAAIDRGIWPSLLAAPMGAAATAGVLLQLSADQFAAALRLALTRAVAKAGPPVPQFPGRWWVFGESVAGGVAAARAAAAGLGAAPELDALIGEGARSEFAAPIDGADLGTLTQKPFATARQGANAIVAFQDLIREHALPASAIARVDVVVPRACAHLISQPFDESNRISKIINSGFQLALAAFCAEKLRDVERNVAITAPMRELAASVTVSGGDRFDAAFPRQWPARVTVTTRDGRNLTCVRSSIRGDADQPFDVDGIAAKYDGVDGKSVVDAVAATTDPDALRRTLRAFASI